MVLGGFAYAGHDKRSCTVVQSWASGFLGALYFCVQGLVPHKPLAGLLRPKGLRYLPSGGSAASVLQYIMLKQRQDALLVCQGDSSALSSQEDAWQAKTGTQLYDASTAPLQLILAGCRGCSMLDCRLVMPDVHNAMTASEA